jgi:hypothetical protein
MISVESIDAAPPDLVATLTEAELQAAKERVMPQVCS